MFVFISFASYCNYQKLPLPVRKMAFPYVQIVMEGITAPKVVRCVSVLDVIGRQFGYMLNN